MVAVIEHKVFHVAVSPLLEVEGISVLAFRINPHVEALCHHHHSHRVAYLHLPCRRHIVSRAYGVATHILHCAYLSDECSLVHCSTYRTEVVMQTHALYLTRNSIQLKTVIP